jgi:cyclic pyranopterin phosphate synthase
MLIDGYNRVHNYLRISLTDKCNLNCIYCNPNYITNRLVKTSQILNFEELHRLINIFSELGINKIRFTGGEPLARKGIDDFFASLKNKYKNLTFCITTNGVFLEDKLESLIYGGIRNINISLDSLVQNNFIKISGSDKLDKVLSVIDRVQKLGINPKINTVIIRGINDHEITNFVEFSIARNLNIRFIEFMPFNCNGIWTKGYMPYSEIKKIIEQRYNLIKTKQEGSEVAKDYAIKGNKGLISFITPISEHFCAHCTRLRLTAEGSLKFCLFTPEDKKIDLKKYLRDKYYTDSDIKEIILSSLKFKNPERPDIDSLIHLKNLNMLKIGG